MDDGQDKKALSGFFRNGLRGVGASVSPWLIILVTAPVPVLLGLFFFYKWYEQKNDYRRIAEHFIQRQNTILAYDAMEVATGVSDLLEKAARDVQILSLIPPTEENIRKFYLAQGGDFTHFDMNAEATNPAPLLFYNKILFMKTTGDVAVHYYRGRRDQSLKNLAGCEVRDLCDRRLLEKALTLPVGEIEYGGVLRYYTPKGSPDENEDGAHLGVVYHAANGIYLLGIDYRHIKDHMTTPSFPYVPKRNLMQAYENGNYIHIVDSQTNFIAHPKYWHVFGVDRKTGEPVQPMLSDDDEGTHPLNVLAYRQGRMKDSFDRMLKSFVSKGVDVFLSRNMQGLRRVLSIAPITLEKGQFRESGVFGHVIVGCALDYFEEPKEKVIPYY